MFQLPLTLQQKCIELLEFSSLKSLRLVSKASLPITTEALFNVVVFHPSDESAAKYSHIVEDSKLKKLVQKVIINTDDDPDTELEQPEKEVPDYLRAALRHLGKFPNLKEAELKFAFNCTQREINGTRRYIAETVNFRTPVMQAFLDGLNHAESPMSRFDSITVKNLQDWTSSDVYDSEDFKNVRDKLTRLALQMTSDIEESSPERTTNLPAFQQGISDSLPRHWLTPLQSQLTHLTLYSAHSMWGLYPLCDFRKLQFPNLESLALGNYTIARDWQIDWILSHGPTLKELILDGCPIITVLCFDNFEEDLRPPNLEPLPGSDPESPCYLMHVDLRWHNVLPKFESGLPNLEKFVLGCGDWDGQTMFEKRYDLKPEVFESRYYMFDGGTGPSQWLEPSDADDEEGIQFYTGVIDEEETLFPFPDCHDQDADALRSLLGIISRRSGASTE
ncbi:hypothetical protein BS50DRAFT_568904 [Corynespora cassiicola Philippines]|uniref:F-box domain-containing protein n=1 Tax=Corynespora cassiicola Philippines TaxID=1448308 RepID=A0A2T2P6W0_CORCC|nr:hypothetical protein BS50DRAFT_568904 [Corynespora cassiicola Philippines]